MGGLDAKLSRKEDQAVAALLTPGTLADAAHAVGIGERTLRNWLKRPTVLAAYRAARRELVQRSIARVQAASGTAVDTIVAVAKDGPKDADRVRAAVALLDHAYRGMELIELETRLLELEQRLTTAERP